MYSDSLQLIEKGLYLWSTKEIMSEIQHAPCKKFIVSVKGDCRVCGYSFESHLTPEWPPPPKVNSVEWGAEELKQEIEETLNEIIDHRYITPLDKKYIQAVKEIEYLSTSQMKKKVEEIKKWSKVKEDKYCSTEDWEEGYTEAMYELREFLTNKNNEKK